jgi:hypothetical protein
VDTDIQTWKRESLYQAKDTANFETSAFLHLTQSSRIKAKSDFVGGSSSLIKSTLQVLKSKGQGSRPSDTEVIASLILYCVSSAFLVCYLKKKQTSKQPPEIQLLNHFTYCS